MSPRPVTPPIAVDVIVEIEGKIVLIERKHPPFGWAIPGGFVDVGESLSQAALRELMEEPHLAVELEEQFFTYSDPERDPRGQTISVVFLGHAKGAPRAGDDAAKAALFALDALPALAFDHATVLSDYARYRATGVRPPAMR